MNFSRIFATWLCLSATACATRTVCRTPNGPPRTDDCVQQGGAGEAAVMGGANALVWASGNGCQLAGCYPSLVCNPRSGLCEQPHCGEGHPVCPLGTACNPAVSRCQ